MTQCSFSLPFILSGTPRGYLHCAAADASLLRIDYSHTPLEAPVPPAFASLADALAAYGKGAVIDHWPVTTVLKGSPFFLKAWHVLSKIVHGDTISYTELARRTGHPNAIRAAASACAKNPLPLIIPCHRVIAKDGGLGGFAWGLDIKQALLAAESMR